MREYKQELFAQKTPYLQWLKIQEKELQEQYGQQNQIALGKQIHTLPFSSCMDSVHSCGEFQEDAVYLFVKNSGKLSNYAETVFAEAFAGGTDVVFVYADEDYKGSLGELYGIAERVFGEDAAKPYCAGVPCADSQPSYAHYRGAPWFKPDYSPDTLASFFYIGGIFAIRGERILKVTEVYGGSISIYELVYRIFMDALGRKGIVHIPRVLYTNDSLAGAERLDSSGRIKALYEEENKIQEGAAAAADKISIVIPSKDNAKVLQKCLETLTQYTSYDCYEIIIVDNGSDTEQRMWITHTIDALKKEKKDLAVQYLYQKMEFNFSAMCNAGARCAEGRYLLFLNDDIEIMDTIEGRRWLDRMMLYARKAHVGAVGAKLYYPPEEKENACYIIQHAGITNMGIGPAHKLCGMADTGCMYHGHNTHNCDMLAVTAACMLIRKSVFDEAGGFDETFPVAYNDVELCFRLYRRGYFNVQVNEAVLIHHESLSRGQDTAPEKQKRLLWEKAKLYQKHTLLNARDPFYSPNLVQWKKDVEYNTEYQYDYDRQITPVLLENSGAAGKRKRAVFKRYDLRALLHIKCKAAAKIYDRLAGYHNVMFHIDNVVGDNAGCDGRISDDIITDHPITDDNLMIEGWYALRNADNADIPRKLWLICETRSFDFRNVYEFDIAPKLREDVAQLLEQTDAENADRRSTKNTALSGIQVNIKKSALRPGTYRIGVLCRDKLVCDLEKYVKISGSNAGDTKDTKDKERCDA